MSLSPSLRNNGNRKVSDEAAAAAATSSPSSSSPAPLPAPTGPRPPPHHRGVSWGVIDTAAFSTDVPPASGPTMASQSQSLEQQQQQQTKAAAATTTPPPPMMTAQQAYEATEAALRNTARGGGPHDGINTGGMMMGGSSSSSSSRNIMNNNLNHNNHNLSSQQQVKLDDLIQMHPMETEAETHILQALERHDAANAANGGGPDMAVLGNIPDDFYSSSGMMENATNNNAEPPLSQQRSRIGSYSYGTEVDYLEANALAAVVNDSTTTANSNNNNNNNSLSDGATATMPTVPMSYTTPVVDSVWSNSVVHENSAEENIQAVEAALSQTVHAQNLSLGGAAGGVNATANANTTAGSRHFRPSTHPPPQQQRHRRQKTMEQTLNSLTSALNDLHRQTFPIFVPPAVAYNNNNNNNNNDSSTSNTSAALLAVQQQQKQQHQQHLQMQQQQQQPNLAADGGGSADAFAAHMSVLFRPSGTNVDEEETVPLVTNEDAVSLTSSSSRRLLMGNNNNNQSRRNLVSSPSSRGRTYSTGTAGEASQGGTASAGAGAATAPPPSDVSDEISIASSKKNARLNWSLLKESVIQNGPAAAIGMHNNDYGLGAGSAALANVVAAAMANNNNNNNNNNGSGDHEGMGAASHMSSIPEGQGDLEQGGGAGGMTSDGQSPINGGYESNKGGKGPGRRDQSSCLRRCCFQKTGLARDVDEFIQTRRTELLNFLRTMFSIMLPCLGLAFLFYYVLDNPDTRRFSGKKGDEAAQEADYSDPSKASLSWWILFLGVRQVTTLILARLCSLIVVDFICLEHRWSLSCFGPTLTLMTVQAKGWPSVLFFWSALDLALLCGDFPLANHWGYWQDWLSIFNEDNPSGDYVQSQGNVRLLLVLLGISIVVAIKRFWIGFYQGRKLFVYYAQDLAVLIKKLLLVSQVAALAMQLEHERNEGRRNEARSAAAKSDEINVVVEEEAAGIDDDTEDQESAAGVSEAAKSATRLISEKDEDEDEDEIKRLSYSQRMRIDRILGNWSEPDSTPIARHGPISVRSILQFRKSMAQLANPFPFSYAFGRASTREGCIDSAQKVYFRLLAETPGETSLSFNVLALTALQADGTLVPEKVRELVQIFRPNQKGNLTLVEFCKSIDTIYKELRLLRASVRNSQKIDLSFERIFNVVFYTILCSFSLALLGYDPLALFLSLSSLALAFSFMISQASSTYFNGLLFILCRRPYDIGDRIVVQSVESPSDWNGTTDWIVKDIDLFKTTLIFAYTNEYATVSNGSLANSRIMNGARSDPAYIYILMRFGIDVTYGQLELYKEALTRYVEARPRDWTKLWCLRALDVKADQGYIEYMICVESRCNWQDIFHIWHIRGVIRAFCHELAKQLDMRYVSPPMPVDLRMRGSLSEALEEDQRRLNELTQGLTAHSEQIQQIIRDKYR